jgi:DNA-directed RNA polymerase subunit M/transcription elongation factor TFIIS
VYISMSDNNLLEFCPACHTLLVTEKDSNTGVVLKCSNCDYSREILGRHLIHSNKFKDDRTTKHVPFCTIFDSAVKRSSRIVCQNAACPSRDPNRWGQDTDQGIKVEPNVMIASVYSADRTATYICRICHEIFRP